MDAKQMDAKQCPHCGRWALKDAACAFVFACGLETNGSFVVGTGCGKSWCWTCGKKFCGAYIDSNTGKKLPTAQDVHGDCCKLEGDQDQYCPGGHSSHCKIR